MCSLRHDRRVVNGRRPLASLLGLPLPDPGCKLDAVANGRKLTALQLMRHACRVPGCGFTNRSPEFVHGHYRDAHPEYDYLGSIKVMIDRDAKKQKDTKKQKDIKKQRDAKKQESMKQKAIKKPKAAKKQKATLRREEMEGPEEVPATIVSGAVVVGGLVLVEEAGEQYAAKVLRLEADRCFVHYQGYNAQWDVWLERPREEGEYGVGWQDREVAAKAMEPVVKRKVESREKARVEVAPVGQRRKALCYCAGCSAADCETCANCLDAPRNGGPNRRRQRCVERKCTTASTSGTVVASGPAPQAGSAAGATSGWPEVRHCFVRLDSCPRGVKVKKEPEEVEIIEPEDVVTAEQLLEEVVAKERTAWEAKQAAVEARARLMARMNIGTRS